MRRRFFVTVILVLLTFCLFGCSPDDKGEHKLPPESIENTGKTSDITGSDKNGKTDNDEGKTTEIPEKDSITGREEIRIAVIDSGFSTAVIGSESIIPGKNYICPERDTEDRIGHGTALAAFIVGSEPARIEGYCPEAKLVPLVYADTNTEDGKEIMGGPDLVATMVRDAVDVYGCRIILISSGTPKDEPKLREAVRYASEKNVLVVSCAGNNGETEQKVYYPGAYEEVLCVGSVNEEGEPAYFSQNNEFIDVWEIGTDLRLATLKGTRIRGEGTSYSAAIVAGKAAGELLKDGDLSVDEICCRLKKDK